MRSLESRRGGKEDTAYMTFLQDVSSEEISEAIELLTADNALLSVTVRHQGRWVTFRTRAIASRQATFWVDMPRTDHLSTPYEFRQGEHVGVAFSAAHRKYVFQARVVGSEAYQLDENVSATALKLQCSGSMHKVERRLHSRLDPMTDEIARASLWLGGQEARPLHESVTAPVWAGRILNISNGGLMVRTSCEAAKYVEVGDIVGLQVTFDGEEASALVDAQVRHSAPDSDMALIGIQFVETEQASQDTAGIEAIRRRVTELEGRRRHQHALT
jgi:hypothetical protein